MDDVIGVAAGQWVYRCRGCGYQVTGDRGDAEKAQRIHRHRFMAHGRCGYQALISGTNRKA